MTYSKASPIYLSTNQSLKTTVTDDTHLQIWVRVCMKTLIVEYAHNPTKHTLVQTAPTKSAQRIFSTAYLLRVKQI